MNIERIEHGSKGAFIIKVNNERLAEMTYSKAGDKLIIIDHTEVSDALRGKGAGKNLLQRQLSMHVKTKLRFFPCAHLRNQCLTKLLSLTMYSTPDFNASYTFISIPATFSPIQQAS